MGIIKLIIAIINLIRRLIHLSCWTWLPSGRFYFGIEKTQQKKILKQACLPIGRFRMTML